MFMEPIQKSKASGKAAQADSMLTRPFIIRNFVDETYDTFTIDLEPENRPKDFAFAPGQFNMLYVFGVGEVPISISGDSENTNTLVHTTRAVGTVTNALRKLKIGSSIGVRGPFGSSWPVTEAEGNDVVIVTGGIGLAPLRPAIYHLLSHREKYGKLIILYGARTPEDILYPAELKKWPAENEIEVHQTVDRATGTWQGTVGEVTKLIPRASFDAAKCTVMVCGPEIMMRFTIPELNKAGVADDRIYISMERNMKCGIGLCGHCQLGGSFVCKDGPVYKYSDMTGIFAKREM